jgi:hypothetical protein
MWRTSADEITVQQQTKYPRKLKDVAQDVDRFSIVKKDRAEKNKVAEKGSWGPMNIWIVTSFTNCC